MSDMNKMNFFTSELYELNMLILNLKSVVDLTKVISWVNPTKTYEDINYCSALNSSSYQNVLENIIDR